MKKNTVSSIVKVVITLTILYLLYRETSFDEKSFYNTMNSVNFNYFFLSLPFVIILLAVKGYRWNLIVNAESEHYSYKNALQAYFASYSLGIVTPGRLGELLKVYNLREEVPGIDPVIAFRTVVVDRLFDLVFLVWFGMAAAVYYSGLLTDLYIILPLTMTVVVFSIFFFQQVLIFVQDKWLKKSAVIHFIQTSIDTLLSKKSLPFWGISAVAYAFFFLGIVVLFKSIDVSMGFFESGFIISLIGLILLLPVSVAGFGTREAGLVYLLSLYGISAETAISFSLLQFTVFFLWGGLVGLVFWMVSPISFKDIRSDSKKILDSVLKRNGKSQL